MADNDDWFIGLDEDDIEHTTPTTPRSKRTRTQAKEVNDAQSVLPLLLIESVIGKAGVARMIDEDSFCLVVEAPSADWVSPIQHAIRRMGVWDHHQSKSSARRSSFNDEATAAGQVVKALAAGGRIFGVSQAPKTMLTPAIVAAADMHVVLPSPSNAVIGAAIRMITGKGAKNMPDAIAAGLGFDEIASCLRQGSTPKECIDRLVRAGASKRRTDSIGDDVPTVEQLHGYGDEVRTWALNLVDDLQAWRQGEIAMADIDRNVVLSSSPGLGKTTFVRSLSKSTGLPLIATSVAQWFLNSTGHLDGVIKAIDEVFNAAKSLAPAILFLDELDGLPNRATLDSKNSDWWAPVIGHILTTLDGATSSPASQLIVIGATNHPEKLDAALVRPGRLNRAIEIPMPDERALAGILRQHLGDDLPGADLSEAARLATGSSGAKIVAWVKAARRTARSEARAMVMADLLDAIAPADQRELGTVRRIALHEAGHAVAAHVLGTGAVRAISIIGQGTWGGYVHVDRDGTFVSRDGLERAAMQSLAGRAAEEVILGEPGPGSGGASDSDLANATRVVALIHLGVGLGDTLSYRGDADDMPHVLARDPRAAALVEAHLRQLYVRTIEIVRTNAALVEVVADELIERRFIAGDRFLEIVEAVRQPAPVKEANHG